MKTIVRRCLFTSALTLPLLAVPLSAQVPQLINYQGRVVIAGTNFGGSGQFKFALVNSNATPTFWSNNGTSVNGSEPSAAVTLTVANGLYSVLLGDATLANMTVIPATVFTNADVRLRVWFNGGSGFQMLTPDQRIAAVGYAMMSANVPDGVITASKLADGAVTASKIADGTITSVKLATDSVGSTTLADSIALGATNINGRLDVYRTTASTPAVSLIGSSSQISTYGSDGQEQIRLWGVSYGEILLNNSLSNNATAVRLTAQGSSGGQLELRNTNGVNRALLEGENTGGRLTLYQADGNTGLSALGDSGGSGLLQLRSTNGSTRVSIYGKSPDSGGGEVSVNDDDGSEVVELKGNAYGGQLTIRDDTGARNTAFVGSSSAGGGYGYFYNANGNVAVYLDGDVGGGGYIGIRNTNGSTRAAIDGYSTAGGGEISVYDSNGTETIEILGAESSTTGGQILMRNGNGGTTIQLDSDGSGVACGYLSLYQSNGTANIILDAASGTVRGAVVEITGGSDLSEKFDIGGSEALPGMVVCIDPENPGRLVPSQHAYDRTVAGVVSGAGGVAPGMLMGQAGTLAHGKHPVALTGRVYCMVDADAGGAIEPGDLITTSNTPGHGMKVGEFSRSHGATIGKAMTSLKSGKGLVLVLVALQ